MNVTNSRENVSNELSCGYLHGYIEGALEMRDTFILALCHLLHHRRIVVVLATVLAVNAVAAGQSNSAHNRAKVQRILFIGNSYTYFHNLPCLVSQIAATRGKSIETKMIASGGATLGDLWKRADTQEELKKHWDAIVLQTQSTFGKNSFINGAERIIDTSSLLPESKSFVEVANGARVYLYEHWRHADMPLRDQLAINRAFREAAEELHASVIPAGLAWQIATDQLAANDLYFTDGSHPSETGAYLTALTAYAALTGDSTVGVVKSIECAQVDLDSGLVAAKAERVQVDAKKVLKLQRAAAEAIREWPMASQLNPAPVDAPTLPQGADEIGNLDGIWTGETKLYPKFLHWPAQMKLVITGATAQLTISFGGKPQDLVHEVSLSAADRILAFDDLQGPNKTIVKYHAIRKGDELIGISEFTGNPNLTGIGEWDLKRAH